MMLRFKKKNLQLEEIQSDVHGDQISGTLIDHSNRILITASNDLTIALHRMTDDRMIDKTVLRFKIEEKINDMVGESFNNIFIGDINGTISKFTIRY